MRLEEASPVEVCMSGKSWSAGVCLGAAYVEIGQRYKCDGKLESLRAQSQLAHAIELREV